MNPLDALKDQIAKEAFGWTRTEAQALGLCIKCRGLAHQKCHTKAGVAEYVISGLCEECFDEITKDPDEV